MRIISVDYPGRGSKIKEPLVTDIHELVDLLHNELITIFKEGNFSFFGHSLGGLVSYLLAAKLIKIGEPTPTQIFISGAACPASDRRNTKLHLLPNTEFYSELSKLCGLPREFHTSSELQTFFEPILRNDVMISEKYNHKQSAPLPIPLNIMFGQKENFRFDDLIGWKKESTFAVDFYEFPGDHFFIYDGQEKIREIIIQKLKTITV